MRQLAAVLLRRALFSSFDEIAKSTDETFLAQLKGHVIGLLQKNISLQLRKKICDVASELSKNCIGMCYLIKQCLFLF